MKKSSLIASILIPLAAAFSAYSIGETIGWNSCERYIKKQLETQLEQVRDINDSKREFRYSLEEMYINPNSENAQNLERAARKTWMLTYLHSDSLEKQILDEFLIQFITDTTNGIEALHLLKGSEIEANYGCVNSLENYRTLATMLKEDGKHSERIFLATKRKFENRKKIISVEAIERQEYEWRKKVRDYADIDPIIADQIASMTFKESTKSDPNN